MTPTIGLAMMASNEEKVIGRALESVRDHIDWWTITDTGSTDNTEAIARRTLAGIPGQYLHEPWVDFGHNRSVALRANHGLCDYSLMLDADDEIEFTPQWTSELFAMNRIGYYIPVRAGSYAHNRLHFFRTDVPWEFEGRVHERPKLDRIRYPSPWETAPIGARFITYKQNFCEGFHSSNPNKFLRDAEIMREDWLRTGDPRWLFLLAQSYKDAGRDVEAVQFYQERAWNPDGWDQERYVSFLEIAKILRRPEWALLAYEIDPSRIEALVWLGRLNRLRNCDNAAELFLAKARELAANSTMNSYDSLDTEVDCWEWRVYDESALVAQQQKRYTSAKLYGSWAMRGATPDLADEQERTRLAVNMAIYTEQAKQ